MYIFEEKMFTFGAHFLTQGGGCTRNRFRCRAARALVASACAFIMFCCSVFRLL